MAKQEFKTESKRLLDLMIHSIYTHREIFLRELISNASDAIDKLYYRSLSENITGIGREDFAIELSVDKDARTLTVSDNGVGMTRDELEDNLGTIAKSGSLAFKSAMEEKDDVDIIGQFGVGFYASFMVADAVTVVSRAFGSDEAWCWQSSGTDGYTIEPAQRDGHGTTIVLTVKTAQGEDNYDEFLESRRIQGIVRKYSDYIRYPIKMAVEHTRRKEGSSDKKPEWEEYTEIETLNSMTPIWKKQKSEVTDEELHSFYQEKFYDYEPPLKVIRTSGEGAVDYNALLFIPARTPFNYYTKEYERGLQLYASGVMIMEKCADLLPDFFGFVKGLVDSQDLSLNISREMLQHDRQLKLIASRLEKKIKNELESMLTNQREEYEKFFDQFGLPLKYGVYSEYGRNKELLRDLLLFRYSGENTTTTLAEYVARMKEDQKYIYYACGGSVERLEKLPQSEAVLDKGYEVLYLTDDVDEFALKMLEQYDEKAFRSVAGGDLGFDVPEEKQPKEAKSLLKALGKALDGKVKEVRLSTRLKTHPVCLTSEGEVSIEMEKVLNAMPDGAGKVQAEKVLEINESHPIYARLQALHKNDKTKLADYAALLYDQALLIEGLPIEDPVAFSTRLCALMAEV